MTDSNNTTPYGYCHCGCGQKTRIIESSCAKRGAVKGEPRRFMQGHVWLGVTGPKHSKWNGGVYHPDGYTSFFFPDHARANVSGYVKEHILIAERILGKSLPPKAQVHHVNGDRSDNAKNNLVICQDDPYHKLIEQRTRAFYSCGNANWRKCKFCKEYDDPNNLYIQGTPGGAACHRTCRNDYGTQWEKRQITHSNRTP